MLDLVIRGARVIDGSGQPGHTADIAVVGDRIAAVAGARVPGRARRVIDADGLVAAPGFVDLHSHSDYHLLLAPSANSSLRQGVTLEIGGNCGYRATYAAPWAFPDGVHAVLVNGQLALGEGSPTGLRAGRVVHRHARARGDHGTGVEPAGSIAGRRPAG
jgi:N-acyl-D-aspartate/D-glutamate deacylase